MRKKGNLHSLFGRIHRDGSSSGELGNLPLWFLKICPVAQELRPLSLLEMFPRSKIDLFKICGDERLPRHTAKCTRRPRLCIQDLEYVNHSPSEMTLIERS